MNRLRNFTYLLLVGLPFLLSQCQQTLSPLEKTENSGAKMGVCSFSQGFYFRSPVGTAASANKWPLTIGGKSYTQAEGMAIFKGRAGGHANISNMFTQAASIKLSVAMGNMALSGAVAPYVSTIDTYLGGMSRLNGSGLLANSKLPNTSSDVLTSDAVAAANNISVWIENNHCAEVNPTN